MTQLPFTSRTDYPDGYHKKCATCEEGRPVDKFPDDVEQPDSVSIHCNHCHAGVKAAEAQTAGDEAARDRLAASMAAVSTEGLKPPAPVEEVPPEPVEPKPESEEEAKPINNGSASKTAIELIEDHELDLADIPGRESDGKVTVTEVRAYLAREDTE